jgi:hypothetical protein
LAEIYTGISLIAFIKKNLGGVIKYGMEHIWGSRKNP